MDHESHTQARHRRFWLGASCLVSSGLVALALASCGSGSSPNNNSGSGGGGGTGGGGNLASSAGPGMGPGGGSPPEKEVESTYGAPVATGKYVWIANPTSGRVAYIDATTLEIKLVDAGNGPTFVAPVPDPKDDVAIVLNVLSLDATVLRASASGLEAKSIPVPSSGNSWAVSGDGHWAIAWTDARHVMNADPVEGYQDITVLDLTKGAEKGVALTVGYRPVGVGFDAKSSRAFAVTQDGVSVVALDGKAPAVVKNIPLTDKPSMGTVPPDVSITPDGAYAIVRSEGQMSLGLFSLADGKRTDIPLPSQPTDLDLSADGSTAVAVLRDTSQVALAKIKDLIVDPTLVSLVTVDATIGSAALASNSSTAFFYTNATSSKLLAVMDIAAPVPAAHTVLMRAPVLAVFPTADAAHALVLHDALIEAGSNYPAAVSLVPVALNLPPKIVGLNAPVISLAIAPAGDHALVATGNEATAVYQLALASMPSLKVQIFSLASLPIAAGIVAGANRGFVAQKHPDGRLTFVNLDSGEARTLTGFELGTQVVDGTK